MGNCASRFEMSAFSRLAISREKQSCVFVLSERNLREKGTHGEH